MGIRLDWEIEAEKSTVQQVGEDPVARQRRRRARLWILILMLGVVAIIAGAVYLVQWRLETVDAQVEHLLRNTVDAEVAALRLGDLNAFMNAQRSASQDWLQSQAQVFQNYQQLKLQSDLQLTGQVLNVTVVETRARVEVREIIDGLPYSQIWFYWRYDDGWRHVPPDYTFWGEPGTASADGVSVAYQTVDQPLADVLVQTTSTWVQTTCAALACSNTPAFRFEIQPDPDVLAGWTGSDPGLLRLPSPYLTRSRTDRPLDLTTQMLIGGLLAERLLNETYPSLQAVYPADSFYVRSAVVAWLTGRYTGVQSGAYLIDSLVAAYGDAAISRALIAMQNGRNMAPSIIAQAAGVASDEQARVDWRDFLTWRLRLEADFGSRRDENNFVALYDLSDPTAAGLAAQRYNAVQDGLERTVVAAEVRAESDGRQVLVAHVQVETGGEPRPEEARFRLVENSWKRIN